MAQKIGPRELALREQREREAAALEQGADGKRRPAKRVVRRKRTEKQS